jgi:putative transcriptional regulator
VLSYNTPHETVFGRPEDAAPGQLLLANPFLGDENFKRTVVLLVEHSSDGSLGFVLNRITGVRVVDALDGLDDTTPFAGHLYLGGPVQLETLSFVHRLGPLADGAVRIGNGLYWGGDFERLKQMLREGRVEPDEVRFFMGYSGWGEGQLTTELTEKSWILHPANQASVFEPTPQHLWRNVLRSKGQEYAMMANFPEDPRLN